MKKSVKSIAKEVIDLEINALKKLKSSLNSSLDKAVDLLTNCQSKVIVCGVGKSGIIASKIAATLSSVGTPAFSISANDCSHGDLGSITKKDIVIEIANNAGLKQVDVKVVVQKFLDSITHHLSEGQTVELRNFGIFRKNYKC